MEAIPGASESDANKLGELEGVPITVRPQEYKISPHPNLRTASLFQSTLVMATVTGLFVWPDSANAPKGAYTTGTTP